MKTKLIIALHGYGSCGNDFKQIFNYYNKIMDGLEIVYLDAPYEHDSGFGRQWFPLNNEKNFDNIGKELDFASPKLLNRIENIAKERSIDLQSIDIIGFSQGAMLALSMIYYATFGHIIGYSGFFVPNSNKSIYPDNNILLIHGIDDDILPYSYLKSSFDDLKKVGCNNVITYTMFSGTRHSISEDGLKKCIEFINT